MKLRIVLADDHQMFRHALRALLEKEPDFEVVGEAADGEALLRLVADGDVDIVCIDIGMPGMNGIDATRRLHTLHPEVRVTVKVNVARSEDEAKIQAETGKALVAEKEQREVHVEEFFEEAPPAEAVEGAEEAAPAE